MNSIKTHLILTFLMLTTASFAQIFEGLSEPVYSLNSPYGEDFIALHPSGRVLLFTRLNHPYNQGGKSDPGDIWKSTLNEEAAVPSNWHELNTQHFSSPIGYTSDGSVLIYNKISTIKKRSLSELWAYSNGQTKKMTVKYFKNKSTHQSGCLSADNRYMIISMESAATEGVEDLYLLRRTGDGWSAPKNLGPQINTAFQEITPFLSANNTTLYFATNGRAGEGSFDIYYSERLDDTWRRWSTPKNLGPFVNSQGRETSFTFLPDADYAYFVSTQNSDGYGDIRRVKFSRDSIVREQEDDTTQLIQIDKVVSVTGIQLVNAKSSEPILTQVFLASSTSKLSYTPDNSGVIPLVVGTVEVEIKGFLSTKVHSFADSLIVVRMEPLEVGRTIRLKHVLFDRASVNMLASSYEELDIVVKMMKQNLAIKILLKGHTDGNGDALRNKKLSEARVQAVKRYLISKGISKKKIKGVGLGGLQPIASNATEATRKLNRRVEFEILK